MKKYSLSEHNNQSSMRMDRKATVKKSSQVMSFYIFENNHHIARISLPPTSTVGSLLSQTKSQLGPYSKNFIGLASRNNNQLIDYTLKMKNFLLSNFPNNMQLQIQRRGETELEDEPSLCDFQFLKLLGSGVSASVYLVRHRCNARLYAMKQIKKSYFRQYKRMQQVLRQRKIMIQSITDIPFTTRLIASFQSQKFLNFLIQYYPGGEMFLHLQRRRLLQQQAKLYVAEMVLAFEKLHERKIIYRDLKPQNIMIDFDGHARLGDFGLCKKDLGYYDFTYSYCGSEEYMAPEVKAETGYNYSVDFYTLGSFAYELVMGVPPYYNNQQLTFHHNSTDDFIELVTKLIQSNMYRRLKSFHQIKRLNWFKSIQWKKVLEKKYQMPFKLHISQNYIGEEFKNQPIDPEIHNQQRFDKLLQCFFYLSDDKSGISEFYNKKKPLQPPKSTDPPHKKKRTSVENLQTHSRKSQHSKNSQRSSKSNSKSNPKNLFNKNTLHSVNIYTSENFKDKSSKKILSEVSSSKSKIHKKMPSNSSQEKTNVFQPKKMKKSQRLEQKPQKITMKKVKSSNNLGNFGMSTYNKVIELRSVFSPKKKVVSPNKQRVGPFGN